MDQTSRRYTLGVAPTLLVFVLVLLFPSHWNPKSSCPSCSTYSWAQSEKQPQPPSSEFLSHLLEKVETPPSRSPVSLAMSSLAPPSLSYTHEQFFGLRKSYEKQDYLIVLDTIQKEIHKVPSLEHPKWLFLLGLAAQKFQNWPLAESAYLEVRNGPQDFLKDYAQFQLAETMEAQFRWSDAIVYHRGLKKWNPNSQLLKKSEIRMSEDLIQVGAFTEAHPILVKLARKYRQDLRNRPQILYNLALVEKSINRQKQTCPSLRELYHRFPQFPLITSWGPYLKKNLFLGEPSDCPSDFSDFRKRIKRLQWLGAPEQAKKELQIVRNLFHDEKKSENRQNFLDGDVEDIDLDQLEAQILIQSGSPPEEALQLLLPHFKSSSPKSKNWEFLLLLANTAARTGDIKKADEVYSYAIEYISKPYDKIQSLFQQAFFKYQIKEYDQAINSFTQFLKKFPKSRWTSDAQWYLGWSTYLKGEYAKAYDLLANHRNHLRKTETFQYNRDLYWMAMSLMKSSQVAKAKPLFEILSMDPQRDYYSFAASYRVPQVITALAAQEAKVAQVSVPASAPAPASVTRPSLGGLPSPIGSPAPPVAPSSSSSALGLTSPQGKKVELEVAEQLDTREGEDKDGGGSKSAIIPQEVEGHEELDLTPLPGGRENQISMATPLLKKHMSSAQSLRDLGLSEMAQWDLGELERFTLRIREAKEKRNLYLQNLISQYESVGCYYCSSYIGQVYFSSERTRLRSNDPLGKFLWEATYPKAFLRSVERSEKEFQIPRNFIWSIMRTESQYRKETLSVVGAIGLMQIMPSTGARLSIRLKDSQFTPVHLADPEVSIRYGTYYLRHLTDLFGSSLPLVSAAYNAGPHRVQLWLSYFGTLEPDEFIEHIPFTETRNYIKRVITTHSLYTELYSPSGSGNREKGEKIPWIEAIFSENYKPKIPTSVANVEKWD